jgi:uroporphyrin-III C-methyltransferase
MKGKVYLVGAGPGDPELLTLKALRLLRTADAVLHDDLVAPEILDLIPSSARIFNVGKRCQKRKIQQSEINRLMVGLATSGLRVVRLKGGDPLIFGRAGEEIEFLRLNHIAFEIIPGVTSALGAAAAAQIPLTHRRASSALVLITAHRASEHRASEHRPAERRSPEKRALEQDASEWSNLVASGATLVIYMPGQDYAYIARRLTASGLPAETPCVLISRATTKYQRTHRTTVLDLDRAPQLASPTLLVVGEVVRSADPAEVVEEFGMPELSVGNDNLLPAALFKTTPLAGFPPVSG